MVPIYRPPIIGERGLHWKLEKTHFICGSSTETDQKHFSFNFLKNNLSDSKVLKNINSFLTILHNITTKTQKITWTFMKPWRTHELVAFSRNNSNITNSKSNTIFFYLSQKQSEFHTSNHQTHLTRYQRVQIGAVFETHQLQQQQIATVHEPNGSEQLRVQIGVFLIDRVFSQVFPFNVFSPTK